MLFPKINNLKGILVEEHPTLHPDSKQYLDYWRGEKKKVIEGLWYQDLPGQYRFCTPAMYFYANMGSIFITDHKKKTRKLTRPKIRDVEWIIYTDYIIARGFSGFENDDEFSCNLKLLSNTDLTPHCYNKSGNLKTYINPQEYLRKLFDKPLGKPLYENDAENMFILGSRGLGKSYIVAHIALHELLMDGQKEYVIGNKDIRTEIFVGAYKADKSSELLAKLNAALHNLPGSYGSGENYRPAPFYKEMTGTLKVGNTKSPFIHSYMRKENGSWVPTGSQSKILHEVFTAENPQAAAGSRPAILIVEEVALLPNIKDVHGSNTAAQITDGHKMGTSIYIGTGGNVTKIAESEYIFRRPREYDIVVHEDIWENTGEIGLFLPVQYTFTDLKDENGNTDFTLADKRVEQNRKNKKWDALQHEKMNYPTKPSEMFLSVGGTLIPQEIIQNQLKYIYKNMSKIDMFTNNGTLVYDVDAPNGVSFRSDTSGDCIPINNYPTKREISIRGCLTIYEHPPEVIPKDLYKITYDPVRDENITSMNKGVSLATIYVYKSVQRFDGVYDQIVAHYAGRYPNTDDIHELAIKMSLYYNAKIMFENNLPGFYKYCIHTKQLNKLAMAPFLTVGRIDPNSKVRLNVGIRMTTALIIQAEQYLIRWLLEPRETEYDELGNITKQKRTIDYIYDVALLEELLLYNRIINTDRVSALLLLMLWLEEAKEHPEVKPVDEQTAEHPMLTYLKSGKMFNNNGQNNTFSKRANYGTGRLFAR